jgi:AraC-like DNA-binding protein
MIQLQLTGQTDERGNLLASKSETSSRSLEQIASTACLMAYYFARQFKRTSGLPPIHYILAPLRARQAPPATKA